MAITVTVNDTKIDNLTTGAQDTLKTQIEKYAEDIIKEANFLEEVIREDGASTEITSNIILQAVRKNKAFKNNKSNKSLLIARIASTLSLLFTGLLFDSTGYQNSKIKLFIFILVLIVACVSTVLQFVFEDKE